MSYQKEGPRQAGFFVWLAGLPFLFDTWYVVWYGMSC